MKKKLVAKIAVFAAVVVWTLGFLAAGVMFFPVFVDFIGIKPSIAASAMQLWYLITIVLVATFVVGQGFKFVGRWEAPDKEEIDKEE